jgi:hypothetical protein
LIKCIDSKNQTEKETLYPHSIIEKN